MEIDALRVVLHVFSIRRAEADHVTGDHVTGGVLQELTEIMFSSHFRSQKEVKTNTPIVLNVIEHLHQVLVDLLDTWGRESIFEF